MITKEQFCGKDEIQVRVIKSFHNDLPVGCVILVSNRWSEGDSGSKVYIKDGQLINGIRIRGGWWYARRFELYKNSAQKIIVRENNIKTQLEVHMEEKQIIQVKKKNLCIIKVKRDIDGLTVFVQSEIMEEYFKNASGGAVQMGKVTWNKDIEGYEYPGVPLDIPGLSRRPRLDQYDQNYLIDNDEETLNLSLLRMRGLSSGVTLKFPGLYLEKDIHRLRKDMQTFMSAFYIEYIRLCEFEITITVAC